MPQRRMSLKDRSGPPRHQAKRCPGTLQGQQIWGERDNEGKIYVYLDPDVAEQERVQRGASMKPSLQPSNTSLVNALEAHIETLREEVETLRTQLHTLWEKGGQCCSAPGRESRT